jgi:hypothetical protein
MVIAVSFAAGILILRRRLVKRDLFKGVNLIKIFVPMFWPKLFAETRKKGRA